MDLSLQNSGPFICEGGSSEPTEPPWLRACVRVCVHAYVYVYVCIYVCVIYRMVNFNIYSSPPLGIWKRGITQLQVSVSRWCQVDRSYGERWQHLE